MPPSQPRTAPGFPACPRHGLEAGQSLELVRDLREGWRWSLATGRVAYNPVGPDVESVEAPPFRYHYLPARARRPGATKSVQPPREGIWLAHSPCPFDEEDFVPRREVLRLERHGRGYHVVCNHYPVTPFHFLPVRAAWEPAETLPQHLHGPEEIEDLLLLAAMAGFPYHAYFNSNRGADGSQSGSSVNHFHFQLFPDPPAGPSPLHGARARRLRAEGGFSLERVDDWPARHVIVAGAVGAIESMARILWAYVLTIHGWNSAYNIEVTHDRAGSSLRAFLFPRHPAPDAEVPGAGHLSANFGGWELSGNIVIPTRELFEWVRRNPGKANQLSEERLRETTREMEG